MSKIDFTLNGIDEEGNIAVEVPITRELAATIILDAILQKDLEVSQPAAPIAAGGGEGVEILHAPQQRIEPVERTRVSKNTRATDPSIEKRTEKILALAQKGMTASQISEKLGIDKKTVYNTLQRKHVKVPSARVGNHAGGCKLCGSRGPRHKKGCIKEGSSKTTVKAPLPRVTDFQDEEAAHVETTSAAEKRPPLTKQEFQEVKRLFHDEGLGSSQAVAERTKFHIEEINFVLQSKNYGMYIFNRKRK